MASGLDDSFAEALQGDEQVTAHDCMNANAFKKVGGWSIQARIPAERGREAGQLDPSGT